MRQYVVDAFADRIFEGNPAAVCVMERWPEEDLMLKITRENNLSETAFVVKEGEEYRLRWFTPGGEIDLCGHATLAAAHIITRFVEPGVERVGFCLLYTSEKGIVGPFEGSKPRQLLITKEQWQEMKYRQGVPGGTPPESACGAAPGGAEEDMPPFDVGEALDRAEEDTL